MSFDESHHRNQEHNQSLNGSELRCQGFLDLKNWQVEKYRQAVTENRWYMSQKKSRWVDWSEAELDFLEHGYYGCAETWRNQYCSHICPLKSNCLLALQLVEKLESVALSKTG